MVLYETRIKPQHTVKVWTKPSKKIPNSNSLLIDRLSDSKDENKKMSSRKIYDNIRVTPCITTENKRDKYPLYVTNDSDKMAILNKGMTIADVAGILCKY